MVEWLISIISSLVSSKFYGTVIISFKNGKIVNVKKEESLNLPTTE